LSHPKKTGGTAAASADPRWDGFLDKTDAWQTKVSRRLANYFAQ